MPPKEMKIEWEKICPIISRFTHYFILFYFFLHRVEKRKHNSIANNPHNVSIQLKILFNWIRNFLNATKPSDLYTWSVFSSSTRCGVNLSTAIWLCEQRTWCWHHKFENVQRTRHEIFANAVALYTANGAFSNRLRHTHTQHYPQVE